MTPLTVRLAGQRTGLASLVLRRALAWLMTIVNRDKRAQISPANETVSPDSRGSRPPDLGPQHEPDTALARLVRDGWNIGTAPHGYRLTNVWLADPDGLPVGRLVPEPAEAGVVERVFWWRAAGGLNVAQVVHRLRQDPRRYPPPTESGGWDARAVREILSEIKYTGYQAMSYRNGARLKPASEWVFSEQPTHRALISLTVFWAAQQPTPESVRAMRHHHLAAVEPDRHP